LERQQPFTVWELNRYIKGKLQVDPHLRSLWVGGELSNFKWHRSGHMFFTLKDDYASLRCVFFKGNNRYCSFLPSDGMKVWIRGSISVYEKEGLYQLYVEEMEPAGVGSLYLAFEQLKERLQQEGLFQDRYKQSLPRIPRRIALITSPTGAALQDILTTAQRRFPYIKFLVVESLVQGSRAPDDLVRALQHVEKNLEVDLVVLARGGGSLEELWAFNSEELARAIFKTNLPVVTAVGHETDFTIADFVADLRASTPTGAMEMVLPDGGKLERSLHELPVRAGKSLERILSYQKQRLDYALGRRFHEIPYRLLEQEENRLSELQGRLTFSILEGLKERGQKLNLLSEKLEGLSPLNIMQRGYIYGKDEKGNLVHKASVLKEGQGLRLYFADGTVWSRVEKVQLKEDYHD